MEKITVDITTMAHGGAAIGRGRRNRTVFVPYAIPGEKVRVHIRSEKGNYAQATLVDVLRPSPDRVEPKCAHFGVCGGCHFQHIRYEAQLEAKRAITRDQLERIGGFKNAAVKPTLAHPHPWAYRIDLPLSPTPDGGLGLWSPAQKQVIPIQQCPITRPELVDLLDDIELDLPRLRKMTLRIGDDDALLAAIEVEDVEPPQLEADFPISVAIVFPDKTAASLVGDNHIVQAVKGRDFRVSPGCAFTPSPAAAGLVVDTVLRDAALTGNETVVEAYSGVGLLTAFLAPAAAQIEAIERNPDAVADMAANLAHTDNVAVFEGWVEDILPALEFPHEVMVVSPPSKGLSREVVAAICQRRPSRLVYVSSDVATLARDGKQLKQGGYTLTHVQPIDLLPQTYHIETVSLWKIGD